MCASQSIGEYFVIPAFSIPGGFCTSEKNTPLDLFVVLLVTDLPLLEELGLRQSLLAMTYA